MCCIKRAIRRSVEVPYMPLRMPRIIDAARLGWSRVFGGPGRQPLLAAVTASGASLCVECHGCWLALYIVLLAGHGASTARHVTAAIDFVLNCCSGVE